MKVRISGAVELEVIEPVPARLVIDLCLAGAIVKDATMLVLPNDKQCVASVRPVDAKGNPASIEGDVSWGVSDPLLIKIEEVISGEAGVYQANILAAGSTLGTAQVNVQADANLDPGMTTLIYGTLDVQIVGGTAVGFVIETAPLVDAGAHPEPVAKEVIAKAPAAGV